jgi:hypothetical protein
MLRGVPAYDTEGWHDFAVAAAGAAAALAGLLFVAISINLNTILKYRSLPARAAGTLGLLVAMLLVALFVLAPGQGSAVLGVETAAVGGMLAVMSLHASRTGQSGAESTARRLAVMTLLFAPAVGFLVGGVSIATEVGGGLYWVLAGTVAGFVTSVVNAWVLLVEILR